MARDTKVGRNDRCPCGSGRKYKNCCQQKAGRLGVASLAAVIGIVAAAVVLVVLLLNLVGGDSVSGRRCPPGQVWSPQHGHCHDL